MIATTDRLDRYWADELGCVPEALYQGGLTLCAPRHRGGPRWMGWLVPLEVVAVHAAAPQTAVFSVTPALAEELATCLDPPRPPEHYLPPEARMLFAFARHHLPESSPKVHHILSCDASTFTPAPEVFPIGTLDRNDLHASWFRLHFDGPIFVARNERGSIAAWAAIKLKSADVWEMAVVTEPAYRNRGLARSVVSRATQAALDAGKVPLYLHEITNHASARVCRSLGYQEYGYEFTCEAGRSLSRR